MSLLGCHKFWKFARLQDERQLHEAERAFLNKHIESCAKCARLYSIERQALQFLQDSAIEPVEGSHFEARLIRRWRVANARQAANYWSPALAGACIAGVAVLAALQILGRSSELRPLNLTSEESRRTVSSTPLFPEFSPRSRVPER